LKKNKIINKIKKQGGENKKKYFCCVTLKSPVLEFWSDRAMRNQWTSLSRPRRGRRLINKSQNLYYIKNDYSPSQMGAGTGHIG
jgi:hypothetical protein